MAKAKGKPAEGVALTKYETARMLGSRALQISMGAPYLVELSKEKLEQLKYNPLEIAKLELAAGKIPMGVTRPMPEIKREEKPAKKEEKKEE